MKELPGFSAAQEEMKEVLQERLSIIETRMDSFEEKVILVRDDLTTVHVKVMLVEAEVLQMKENFKRNIRESVEKQLK